MRTVRPSRLLLLVVDLSGSMGGSLLALARRTTEALLSRAYLRRDRVAAVAFRGRQATILFRPSNHPAIVARALSSLPCGGTTPLAAGLALAADTLAAARRQPAFGGAVVTLLTDGRANVRLGPAEVGLDDEVRAAAAALRAARGVDRIVLVDATEEGKDPRYARDLARLLAAQRLSLAALRAAGSSPSALLSRELEG